MNNGILDTHYATIVDKIDNGIVMLDQKNNIILWNPFMEKHSGIKAEEINKKNIFDAFSYLSKSWLELKLQSVRLLKSYSFISWTQRPYLFQFKATTGFIEDQLTYMYQDSTFFPIMDNGKIHVCIIIKDVTENVNFSNKIEEMKDITRTLVEIANYDALTSISNRGYIESQLMQEFKRAKRYKSEFSLLMLDIDHFKSINDVHGHLAGDDVLKELSTTVTEQIRDSDLFGRFGGEEFIVILLNTSEDTTIIVAERIRKAVEQLTTTYKSVNINITISQGFIQYSPKIKDYLQMLHDADLALYHSKKNGRNQTSQFKDNKCLSILSD
ncbi:MAG: diguanylate cyclase [Desulfobacteraceae bacterium]|nr:diguanylate cyclase [Desulfobacteraceae bacterium]